MKRLILCACLLAAGCAAAPTTQPESTSPTRPVREGPTPAGQRDLEVLASFFMGNWDSKPGEPPMRLRVAEIWKGSTVRWFYLEWARPGAEARPARQLVLRVAEDGPQAMTTTLHRLPGDAARYAGEWGKPQPFAGLGPEELRAIEACRLRGVRAMIAHFTLVTEGNRCPGDLAGVPFMRFEFSLTSSDLDLLEQARDAAGNIPPRSRLVPFGYARTSQQPR